MIEKITIKNETLGSSILMDMLTSPFVLESVDLGSIQANHTTSKFVNQIGEFLESSTLDTRPISIIGYVVDDTEEDIKYKKSKLSRLINPLEDMSIYLDRYKLSFRPDRTVKYSVNYKENNEVLCKFMITGIAVDPLFKDESENKVPVATTLGMFRFPLTIPKKSGIIMGKKVNSLIATILNNGQVDVGMKITIEAKATVKNPSIVNVKTQERIILNYEMHEGEVIEINTEEGLESVRGKRKDELSDSNYYFSWDLDNSWMKLSVGKNLIRYDAEEDTIKNMDVTISYSQKYLEVQ